MQNKPLAHSNSQGDIHPIIVVVSALLITEVNGWTAAKDPLCWCFELCFTICRIGKRREGSRGAGGARSQPRVLRPYGASTSPALYCTPCCFNQWQACSQDTENRGYCTVSVGFYSMFVSLSYSENFYFILHVVHGMSFPLYAMHLLIYYIYLEASSTALLFLSFCM